MEYCKRMQDQVPTEMTAAEVRQLVEASFGRPLGAVFSSWEDEPFAAASIGQVCIHNLAHPRVSAVLPASYHAGLYSRLIYIVGIVTR